MNFSLRGAVLCIYLAFTTVGHSAEPLGNLIMNGAFEAGNQYWRGDGKVVSLPDGNKVYQLEAASNRLRTVSQAFRMHGLKEVQIVFRARNVKYTGKSLRISVHRPGGGSLLFDRDLPDDGNWKDFQINYIQTKVEEERTLVIALHEGTGVVQIDDVEIREPSVVTKDPSSPPAVPKPATTSKPAAPLIAPAAPEIHKQNPDGSYSSLEQMVDSAPQAVLLKFGDLSELDEAVAEINDHFSKNLLGRHATIRGTVKATVGSASEANKFRINYIEGCIGPNTANIRRCWFWANCSQDPTQNLADLHEGSLITVSGEIVRCDVTKNASGSVVRLNVDLKNSKVDQGK